MEGRLIRYFINFEIVLENFERAQTRIQYGRWEEETLEELETLRRQFMEYSEVLRRAFERVIDGAPLATQNEYIITVYLSILARINLRAEVITSLPFPPNIFGDNLFQRQF